ncbi:hypothetical protein BGZ47_003454 [Haplosporangium gracile]|nr:hypothetical protein BGZ47_003454 [Haplosporangium gracile]
MPTMIEPYWKHVTTNSASAVSCNGRLSPTPARFVSDPLQAACMRFRTINSIPSRPTASDTTVPHGIIRRLYGPPQFRRRARNRPPPADSADEQSVSDRQQAALENRRNVYRNGLFVRHMGANRISGFQQITPETFRIFPQRLDRLVPWIRRELQAITTLSPFLPDASGGHGGTRSADNSNPHEETDSSLEIIREYIIAVCKQYDLQTDQGQDLIRDFLHDHTEHFVHELMGFARSSFSMEAYDRSAQYSSPSSSSTAAVVSSGGGNNGRLNNSEDSIDREPRERTKRRRYESPKDYGHVRGGSDSVQDGDEKRRRNNHDRETQSYFYGEDRATTVESSSSSSRSSRHGVKREYPPQRHASSSTKEVDLREGRSTDPRGSSSSKAEKGLSSDMIPLITVTPKKTDLQAILRAKLKREQDLYASRNKYP